MGWLLGPVGSGCGCMSVVSSSPSKGSGCFLEQETIPSLLSIGNRNGFESDLHEQKELVHNQTKVH